MIRDSNYTDQELMERVPVSHTYIYKYICMSECMCILYFIRFAVPLQPIIGSCGFEVLACVYMVYKHLL